MVSELFVPKGEKAPKVDGSLYELIGRVDLTTLGEGTLVFFSGRHPASNYALKVLGEPEEGLQRKVRIWYLATAGISSMFGPGEGCLETRAMNIQLFDPFSPGGLGKQGILETNKSYSLPTFGKDVEEKVVWNRGSGFRIEPYTQIRIRRTGNQKPLIERLWTGITTGGFSLAQEYEDVELLPKEDYEGGKTGFMIYKGEIRVGYLTDSKKGNLFPSKIKIRLWEEEDREKFVEVLKEIGIVTNEGEKLSERRFSYATETFEDRVIDDMDVKLDSEGNLKYDYQRY